MAHNNRRFLDATTMAQLCAIAKVKDAGLFSYCVHDLIERAWRVHDAHETLQAADLTASAKRVARAAHALDEALREASRETKKAIRLNISHRWPEALDEIHAGVAKLAAAADQVKQRSKPWATVKALTIEQLISDAKRSGGKLARGETGSLVQLLETLKPYFPPGFPLSLATVKRVLRGVKN